MDITYKEKEMKLLQSLIERNGMQDIIDTAAEVFGNPLFICDLGYKIICYSDHDAVYDDFWEHMKNHNYSIPDQIAQIMRTGDFAKIYASDETRVGKYPFADSPFLAARIRDGSHVLGHICVYSARQPFTDHKKVSSTLQLPCPSILRGLGVSFFIIFLHNSLMNILQKIFTDYYEEIKYTLHPRDTEMENIDKMINCGNPSFGGAMYGCPHCGKLKFVPFRCHSRFCPTCGNKYSMERTTSMSFKLVNVQHRHCVFTIDENLRDFFLNDRSLLNCLFHSVTSVVSRMFYKMNKSKNFTPGFIMVLHTFGRDLKWNPHIHCLLSEGGFSDDGFWRNVKHFNYTYLRNAFRTALLNELESRIGPSFKKVKARCYNDHKQGFYVYAKPNLCDPKIVIKYIGRYLGRPVIATSRIDKYDGDMVTFHYNRHEDEKYVEETIPAMDFIKRLIRHIPEKHFKMIRYGGLYARHREIDSKLYRAISKSKHHIYRSFNQWRTAILSSFGYDPLECPDCKHKMIFLELYYNHKRVSLEELYEKAMSKSRGKRSSA